MNEQYKNQVKLLLRIMPLIFRIEDFAVHGGTAINLFIKDMPRYSVDIDLTYIPLLERVESLENINALLTTLKSEIQRAVPGIRVIHKPDVWKLLCTLSGISVKIEVNGTKRGLILPPEIHDLCPKAQKEFSMGGKARIVSFSQLYGGKIAAALSRQHPRDLFDCKYMEINSFDDVKGGLLFALAGSDKPVIESLNPNPVNQTSALENQFAGMSDVPFNYADYEEARTNLIQTVNNNLNANDRHFLLSLENGEPDWTKCCAGDLSAFPSVKWKLSNIEKLKAQNPKKFQKVVEELEFYLFG